MSRFIAINLFARVVLAIAALLISGCADVQITPSGSSSRPPVAEDTAAADAQAQEEFEKAANRAPTDKTLYMLAKLNASQGKDDQAEALLRRVLKENPKFVPAYIDLSESQLRRRRADDAIVTLKAGLAVAPREPVLLNDLGMCHLLKRDYDPALQAFLSAAAIRPDDARYRSNAAMALGMLGRYTEAASLYKQVLPAADVHYNLAVICQARNDTARAEQEFKWAEELRQQQARSPVRSATPSAAPSVGE